MSEYSAHRRWYKILPMIVHILNHDNLFSIQYFEKEHWFCCLPNIIPYPFFFFFSNVLTCSKFYNILNVPTLDLSHWYDELTSSYFSTYCLVQKKFIGLLTRWFTKTQGWITNQLLSLFKIKIEITI